MILEMREYSDMKYFIAHISSISVLFVDFHLIVLRRFACPVMTWS
jgi:hypothetical protein